MKNGIEKNPRLKGWWIIKVNNVEISIPGTKKDAEEEYKREVKLQMQNVLIDLQKNEPLVDWQIKDNKIHGDLGQGSANVRFLNGAVTGIEHDNPIGKTYYKTLQDYYNNIKADFRSYKTL